MSKVWPLKLVAVLPIKPEIDNVSYTIGISRVLNEHDTKLPNTTTSSLVDQETLLLIVDFAKMVI